MENEKTTPGSLGQVRFRSVLLGCFADWFSTFLFTLILQVYFTVSSMGRGHTAAQIAENFQLWTRTNGGIFTALFFGSIFTILGGYVATRTSKVHSLINAFFVGCIGFSGTLAMALGLYYQGKPQPLIITVISLILPIPLALIGGRIFLNTPDKAPSTP